MIQFSLSLGSRSTLANAADILCKSGFRLAAASCALAAALLAVPAAAQVVTVDTRTGRVSNGTTSTATVDRRYQQITPTQVALTKSELDAKTQSEALSRCLAQLEESQRRCVVLAFVDGFSHAQIAARLASPLGSVKSWVRRGLIALKGCLQS